ncbi:hypothetical protein SAMN05880574_11957 [Chryseobacterium sp. RU37D]|uniref:hypothetical protein n=1 Tax=Chryseobacterium sp. RU37D TaxID=1907397 RepID=UPI0009572EC2|nr:hypothetical protein [Chryseobacterium sp. RU37D]SIQ65306.1 hypothetical protein SAMN05880574_11957 [Chryseobacterium sp. RU37D]
MEKISKITLTANNGVFKGLIHEIAHVVVYKKELEKFKFIFSANILETSIIITEKKHFKVIPEDWIELQQFLENKTENLTFTQTID